MAWTPLALLSALLLSLEVLALSRARDRALSFFLSLFAPTQPRLMCIWARHLDHQHRTYMCVCVFVCVCVCVCMYTYIHTYMCVSTIVVCLTTPFECGLTSMLLSLSTYVYVSITIFIFYVSITIFIYVSVSITIFIYVSIRVILYLSWYTVGHGS
jgi:hypothetical protein